MLPINTTPNGSTSANPPLGHSDENSLRPEKCASAVEATNVHPVEKKSTYKINSCRDTVASKGNTESNRVDNSFINREHQTKQQQQQQQEHRNYPTQLNRDLKKYKYVLPQTALAKRSDDDKDAESWTTDATNENALIYYDGNLISGSLKSLIEHMVPTGDYYPDQTYIFSFLLSARLFMRPHELLAHISQTWERQQQQQQQHDIGTDEVDEAHFSRLNIPLASSVPPNIASDDTKKQPGKLQRSTTKKSAQNCIRLLSEWIETFPYDFRDERLMQQVRILARKCVFIDNSLGKQVSRILQLLVQRLTILEKYEEFLQSINAIDLSSRQSDQITTPSVSGATSSGSSTAKAVPTMNLSSIGKSAATSFTNLEMSKSLPKASLSSANMQQLSIKSENHSSEVFGLMDICPSCSELAHQLTAIELEHLSHIGPEEFVQAFAKEYQNTISQKSIESNVQGILLKDIKKTRNLESYVEWFNRLSYLTASEIVKYPKKKQRVRVIEFWIETARECFNIGNFNSLMAIIAGLNLAPIARLKKTWLKVQTAKYSVLEHQMDPTSNFVSYRSTLKAAMWRSEGATDERERIIIPFFSLFVKDLYFLNEGCSNRLPNNHINFEKCSQLGKQVKEFNEWKKVTCPFEKSPNVIAYLYSSPVLNENTLSIASFECEPPENIEEKGRYKTVKAETKQQLLQHMQDQQQQHQQQ